MGKQIGEMNEHTTLSRYLCLQGASISLFKGDKMEF